MVNIRRCQCSEPLRDSHCLIQDIMKAYYCASKTGTSSLHVGHGGWRSREWSLCMPTNPAIRVRILLK